MIHKVFRHCICAIFLIIASCSNIKNNWGCKRLQGGKGNCVSISEADIASRNAVSMGSSNVMQLDYSRSPQKININLIAPDVNKNDISDLLKKDKVSQRFNRKKLRSEERVGRIWFAPYVDSQGYRYSESFIYVVDEESKWIMNR